MKIFPGKPHEIYVGFLSLRWEIDGLRRTTVSTRVGLRVLARGTWEEKKPKNFVRLRRSVSAGGIPLNLLEDTHRAQNFSILLVCVWGHVLFLSSEQFESFYQSPFYNSQKIKFDMKFQFKNRFSRWRNGKFWQNCRQTATSFFDPGSAGISSPSQVLLSPP